MPRKQRALIAASSGRPVRRPPNDLVLTTAFSGALYAFDARTGRTLWETQLPAGINTGVSVSGDTMLAPAATAISRSPTTRLRAGARIRHGPHGRGRAGVDRLLMVLTGVESVREVVPSLTLRTRG